MPSEKQIAANRLNACLSTGPRTAKGKAQSNRNAMTHGLSASIGLFPYESPDEFLQMRDTIFAVLLPEDAVERELPIGLSAFSGGCGAFPPSKPRRSPGSRRARESSPSIRSAFPPSPEIPALPRLPVTRTSSSFWGVPSTPL